MQSTEQKSRKTYEYKSRSEHIGDSPGIDTMLAMMGEEGWKLIFIDKTESKFYFFFRRKSYGPNL